MDPAQSWLASLVLSSEPFVPLLRLVQRLRPNQHMGTAQVGEFSGAATVTRLLPTRVPAGEGREGGKGYGARSERESGQASTARRCPGCEPPVKMKARGREEGTEESHRALPVLL